MKNKILEINNLVNDEMFVNVLQKLYTSTGVMSFDEESFILSSGIVFVREFELTGENRFLEFAYDIFLRYTIKTKDYEPIIDFCVNCGFYPIVYFVDKIFDIKDENIFKRMILHRINKEYRANGYIETKQQKDMRKYFLSNKNNIICLSAPTSFGKSSLIIDHIKENICEKKRVVIIVPTKSLLTQTLMNLRKEIKNIKIIIYDDMYDGEDNFIAVFTQERALRFLSNKNIGFDMVYVDEAHDLFEKGSRAQLLCRFLKLNSIKNANQKLIFISPFINSPDNLKFSNKQEVDGKLVKLDVKEPVLYYFMRNGVVKQYNRFLNQFYDEGECSNYLKYIKENKTEKNFYFLNSPLKIEKFAKTLCENRSEIFSEEIDIIIRNLSEYVHQDFFEIECIRRGVIYLHAKIPEQIKEYLLYKFCTVNSITELVANAVILEGVNLPITSLFVMSSRNLTKTQLRNLIGRVNRLNYVFDERIADADLFFNRLMPKIHFIDTDDFMGKCSMESKLRLLNGCDKDEIQNPLLINFKGKVDDGVKKAQKIDELFFKDNNVLDDFNVKKIISSGLSDFFDIKSIDFERVNSRIKYFKEDKNFLDKDFLDKIYELFFNKSDFGIIDFEIGRLRHYEAIRYYKKFLERKNKSLSNRIEWQISYLFWLKKVNPSYLLYIGTSFGEVKRSKKDRCPAYIKLNDKERREIVNIAIVKQKIEEDFVNYKLMKFVQFLKDVGLLSDEQYWLIMYGTKNQGYLSLMKKGVPVHLLIKLFNDGQINNISIHDTGTIIQSYEFKCYKETVDDITKFEINKYL